METLIELTEDDLSQIAGGQHGLAFVTFHQSAAGPHTSSVSASVVQKTTQTSASQSGFFFSFSA